MDRSLECSLLIVIHHCACADYGAAGELQEAIQRGLPFHHDRDLLDENEFENNNRAEEDFDSDSGSEYVRPRSSTPKTVPADSTNCPACKVTTSNAISIHADIIASSMLWLRCAGAVHPYCVGHKHTERDWCFP